MRQDLVHRRDSLLAIIMLLLREGLLWCFHASWTRGSGCLKRCLLSRYGMAFGLRGSTEARGRSVPRRCTLGSALPYLIVIAVVLLMVLIGCGLLLVSLS